MAGVVALAVGVGCGVRGSDDGESQAGNFSVSSDLVISQLYTGGGSDGSTYNHDYVELFNKGAAPVSLADKSIQYVSSAGIFNKDFSKPLGNITIAPGKYALIMLGRGGDHGAVVPTPNTPADVNLTEAKGKLAIVFTNQPLHACGAVDADAGTTRCEEGAWIDFIGWGETSQSELAPAPTPSKAKALIRKQAGCIDTGDNSKDLELGEPLPHTADSPATLCGEASDAATPPADAGPVDPTVDAATTTDGGAKADGGGTKADGGSTKADGGTKYDGGKKKDASPAALGDDDDDDDDNGDPDPPAPPGKGKATAKAPIRNGASDCSMSSGPIDTGYAAIGALGFAFASIAARRRSRSSK